MDITEAFISADRPYPFTGKIGDEKVCFLPVTMGPVVYSKNAKARAAGTWEKRHFHNGYDIVSGGVSSAEEVREIANMFRAKPIGKSDIDRRLHLAQQRLDHCNENPICAPRELSLIHI